MFKRLFGVLSKRCIGGFRMYPPGFAVYITLNLVFQIAMASCCASCIHSSFVPWPRVCMHVSPRVAPQPPHFAMIQRNVVPSRKSSPTWPQNGHGKGFNRAVERTTGGGVGCSVVIWCRLSLLRYTSCHLPLQSPCEAVRGSKPCCSDRQGLSHLAYGGTALELTLASVRAMQ